MINHEIKQEEEGKVDHNKNHHEDVNKSWEESQQNIVIKKIKAGERLQEIIESLPGFNEAFLKPLDTMVCSDERVPAGEKIKKKVPQAEGIKAGFAGQLILLPEMELLKFIDKYLWKFKVVTSHFNCGAALKKYRELLASGDLPPEVNNGDELGIWHTERLVRLINNRRKEIDPARAEREVVVHIHIKKEDMSGDLHNARGICFDGTGRFNPAIMPDMPATYVSSGPGFGLSEQYCKDELWTLTGIAMSNHAFGDKFIPKDDPFYIFVSAPDQAKLSKLKEWARDAVAEYGKRVEVKGFIAPETTAAKTE